MHRLEKFWRLSVYSYNKPGLTRTVYQTWVNEAPICYGQFKTKTHMLAKHPKPPSPFKKTQTIQSIETPQTTQSTETRQSSQSTETAKQPIPMKNKPKLTQSTERHFQARYHFQAHAEYQSLFVLCTCAGTSFIFLPSISLYLCQQFLHGLLVRFSEYNSLHEQPVGNFVDKASKTMINGSGFRAVP